MSGHPRARGGISRGPIGVPRHVADILRAGIRAGHYDVGDQLVEESLVLSLGASRNSIRAALQNLATWGNLKRARRRGTFVERSPVVLSCEDILPLDDPESLSVTVTSTFVVPANDILSKRLEVEDVELRLVENEFRIKGELIGIRTAYYSLKYSPVPYRDGISMSEVIRTTHGVEIGIPEVTVEAAVADDRTSELLGISLGSPVLIREQVNKAADASILSVVFDHFRADRVAFRH